MGRAGRCNPTRPKWTNYEPSRNRSSVAGSDLGRGRSLILKPLRTRFGSLLVKWGEVVDVVE